MSDFYKDKLFTMIDERLKTIDAKIEAQQKDISEIKGNMKWIYGWAAGAGLFFSIIIEWVRIKVFKS